VRDTVAAPDGEMLVPAVGRDACKRGVIISLCAGRRLVMAAWGTRHGWKSVFFLALMMLETNVTTSENFPMSTSK